MIHKAEQNIDPIPYTGQEYVVDATQLHVDFQTEVGEGLGRGLVHVLSLYTLGGQPKHDVSHTLHFS